MVGNGLLLLLSVLVMGFTTYYFRKKWPDIDVIDVYILFVALYYGVYPFIRSLYLGKGVVYDSYDSNLLAIGLVYLQLVLIVVTIRVVSAYLPARITEYLRIKTLIQQWAKVNSVVLIGIYFFLIIFHFVSYYKYGIKSHIVPDDFNRIGKDLPYWLMSVRKIYSYLILGIAIVLISKAALAQDRYRYYWLALFILYLPLDVYYGRKGIINVAVMSMVIWLVIHENKLFRLKNITIAILAILGLLIASNLHETYRYDLFKVGGSERRLENPIYAAFDFNKTLSNLKNRPGTWEFNYLVFDGQLKEPRVITTNGAIFWEGLKSAMPRIFWPDKQFIVVPEFIANLYGVPMDFYNVGTNIFGINQLEFGYFSIIIVPLILILIIIMTASLMKIIFNYPVFLWLLSMNILNFLICVEENQNELIFFLRYTIIIMLAFISYVLIRQTGAKFAVK